jgi:hypothetical protein
MVYADDNFDYQSNESRTKIKFYRKCVRFYEGLEDKINKPVD